MRVECVAWTQVDLEALKKTGYVSHWDNPADPEPEMDFCLALEDDDGGYFDINPDSVWQRWANARPTDIDELHEACGRGCYESWHRPNPETNTNETYLGKSIIGNDHGSVLEHGSVTLWCDGISRNLLIELERHRHLSLSVISQRYVDHSEKPVVIPPAFAALPEIDREDLTAELEYVHAMSQMAYTRIDGRLSELGFARKKSREAARAALLGNVQTTFFVTGNIRAWKYVIGMRYHPDADAEINQFAREVLVHLKKVAPNSVQDITLAED